MSSADKPPPLSAFHNSDLATLPPVTEPFSPGTGPAAPAPLRIGGYEIIEEIGRGGMGVVYKGRQIGLNRPVALKMILAGAHAGEAMLGRFKAEAEAIARLSHPNIVQIYDVGEHEGRPFIALELIDGGSLADKLGGTPQTPRAAVSLLETLAKAMHAAHLAGIVHRDLKPANILIQTDSRGSGMGSSPGSKPGSKQGAPSSQGKSDANKPPSNSQPSWHSDVAFGNPKITDFGLAKQLESQAGQTQSGAILGTPSYMAPEQAAGKTSEIGPCTDIYALGAILYEALTGHPPFRAATPFDTIMLVLHGEPVPVRQLQPKVPRDLETICHKCLRKEPDKRYQTALELAEDLARFRKGEAILARPTGRVERMLKWVGRHPAVSALLMLCVVLMLCSLMGGIASYVTLSQRAEKIEESSRLANRAVEEGRHRLVRLSVANGVDHLDDNDLFVSLLWFAEALRLDEGHETAVQTHRQRIAVLLERLPRLRQVWQHEGQVNCASFAPDGWRVVTGGTDGVARVWDGDSGDPLSFPLEHEASVVFAHFSPDGRRILTGSANGKARLWDITPSSDSHKPGDAGRLVRLIEVASPLLCGSFSPDGRFIALGDESGRVRLLTVEGNPIGAGEMRHEGPIRRLAFSGDSQWLASAGDDGAARVWSTTTGLAHGTPQRHHGAISSVDFQRGGRLLLTAGRDGYVRLWDFQAGKIEVQLQLRGSVLDATFSPDGRWFVTADEDSTAQVWDTTSGKPVAPALLHHSRVTHARFSPDSRLVLTTSEDNEARVWDAATSRSYSPILRHNGSLMEAEFGPTGFHVLTASQDGLARLWSLVTEYCPDEDRLRAARNKHAAAANADRSSQVALSPDKKLAVRYGSEQITRIRNATTREPVSGPLKHDGIISFAVFSPDGKRLATTTIDGTVQLWDVNTGQALFGKPPRHAAPILRAGFSPNGKLLATASEDNTARVWETDTGKPHVAPIRHKGGVLHVEFCSAGRSLFTASSDNTSRIWDVHTGEPLTPVLPAWDGEPFTNDLPFAEESVAELLDLARVVTGLTIDESGGLVPLDSASLRTTWRDLRSRDARHFTPSATEQLTWRKRVVEAAEAGGHWFAAGWHLDRLIEAEPAQAEWRRKRSAAHGHSKAWTQAEQEADRAIALSPTAWQGWYQRGTARGQMGRWREAAADLALATRLAEEPEIGEVIIAILLLKSGDLPGYRRHCAALLEKHARSEDWTTLVRVAEICVLAPDATAKPADVVALAEKALAKRPGHAASLTVLGGALLRADQADKAAIHLREALTNKPEAPVGWFLLAVAQHRLGQGVEAQKSQQRGVQALTDGEENAGPRSWQQQAEGEWLRAEVEVHLRPAKTQTNKP